nr:segregation and condensation protein B [uncultured archaeon]
MDDGLEAMKRVEAALFVAARFLSVDEIVMLTGINPISVREFLVKLKAKYDSGDSALMIIEKNELWKMDVKAEHGEMITKLASGKAEFTRAEQETLAIIAYKQPIKQSVVVKIRGNKAYEHIKHFIDMNLLKAKRLGHTIEIQLSEQFYDYFQIGKKERQGEGGEEEVKNSQ